MTSETAACDSKHLYTHPSACISRVSCQKQDFIPATHKKMLCKPCMCRYAFPLG